MVENNFNVQLLPKLNNLSLLNVLCYILYFAVKSHAYEYLHGPVAGNYTEKLSWECQTCICKLNQVDISCKTSHFHLESKT